MTFHFEAGGGYRRLFPGKPRGRSFCAPVRVFAVGFSLPQHRTVRLQAAVVCCLVLLVATLPAAAGEALPLFAVSRQAVPVYHRAADAVGGPATDQCGQTRALEFIALPGTPFRVVRPAGEAVEVTTPDYRVPHGVQLFVKRALLEFRDSEPPRRAVTVPNPATMVAALRSAVGLPYVWGGNLRQGTGGRYRGLDCSGLLYEATGGYTPRNSGDLLSFGAAVPVAGLPVEQIAERVRPLDLIVWNGHLIIVLDRDTVIESILHCGAPGNGGVTVTPLQERLRQVMRQRSPADAWPENGGKVSLFVVRRWL